VTPTLAQQVKMPYFRTKTNYVALETMVEDMKNYGIIKTAPVLASFIHLLPGT
jgi:hypothetical protein